MNGSNARLSRDPVESSIARLIIFDRVSLSSNSLHFSHSAEVHQNTAFSFPPPTDTNAHTHFQVNTTHISIRTYNPYIWCTLSMPLLCRLEMVLRSQSTRRRFPKEDRKDEKKDRDTFSFFFTMTHSLSDVIDVHIRFFFNYYYYVFSMKSP